MFVFAGEHYLQNHMSDFYQTFLSLLPVAVARSSFGGFVVYYAAYYGFVDNVILRKM